MSDCLGPSRKRLKQVDLRSFLGAMRETCESCSVADEKTEKNTLRGEDQQSHVPSREESTEQSPAFATKLDPSKFEDIDSSQELFPEPDASNSQASGHSSDSENTVVDSIEKVIESIERSQRDLDSESAHVAGGAKHGETSCLNSRSSHIKDRTIPGSCEDPPDSQQSSQSEESVPDESTIPESFRRTPGCGVLSPEMGNSHTVLCKVTRDETGHLKPCPLVPYPPVPVDRWDGVHVRMPCSPQSQYPTEQGLNGASVLRSRWELIENSLLGDIVDSHSLVKAIRQYNGRASAEWNFKSLHKFLGQELDARESKSFFQVLLPKMIALALRLPVLITQPVPLLKSSQDHMLSMSQLQAGCLLANAFFCTFPRRNTLKSNSEYSNYPDINFNRLFSGPSDEARKMEKLKCIINYFRRITNDEPTGMLTFHRRCLTQPFEWASAKSELGNVFVSASGFIEREGQGMLQVDFANKFVGGGVLGGGCVQEEIRFMMCPELIVSRLFTEALGSREVLVITGVEQFNSTSGYADKFSWQGDFKDQVPRDSWARKCTEVVAMDALCFARPCQQYRPVNIRRELNKAYCGFMCPELPCTRRSAIATGNWGCGAFRGDPQLKAIIQAMAASAAGRDLVYFTFGDRRLCRSLQAMLRFLSRRGITVGGLYELLAEYGSDQMVQASKPKRQLFEYLYSTCSS
uniref:poly(ADP-ribose) glycohydrolase n=1 Tax=Amblyomma aureolatum TaxID=187763 RepID=A0A1E1XC09_9ACAR